MIKFKPTGQLYYGASWKVGCHPDQLFKTYFTSSKKIKKLIKDFGVNSFEYEIRYVFKTKYQVMKCERKVLLKFDAARSNFWLNAHIPGEQFHNKGHSEETKQKLAKAKLGKRNPDYPKNRKISNLVIQANSKRSKGKPKSKEANLKNSLSHIGIPKGNWWTNGFENRLTFESPGENWYLGRTSKNKRRTKKEMILFRTGVI